MLSIAFRQSGLFSVLSMANARRFGGFEAAAASRSRRP
jgi:hypothetical protein